MNMIEYRKIRDEWRIKDGLLPKWTGTNMALAFSLLKRNGSNGIGGEIGEIGKNEAIISTQELEIQGNGETLKDVYLYS